jgi:signal transduction histidine kinase/ActR/RegA family two-component response regulator
MWHRGLIAIVFAAAAAQTGIAQAQATPAIDSGAIGNYEKELVAAKAAMMADPAAALTHARKATALVGQATYSPNSAQLRATGLWLEGEALVRLNRSQEAAPIVESALAAVEQSLPRGKLHGDLLMTRATIAATIGKTQEALANFFRAHDIFQAAGEARSQAMALQYIGMIYEEAGDYPRVLKYYSQAAEVFDGDPALSLSLHNNRANVFNEMGRFADAELEYKQALRVAKRLGSPMLEVRILTNIALAELRNGKVAAADATVDAAFRLAAADRTDEWKQGLYAVRARIAFARKDSAAAARLIGQAFGGVDLGSTTMPYREFHRTAYEIYSARGDSESALAHLAAFKRLDDEAREVRASANAALMGARFDFANQELRISKLKAGQLQRDVLLARSKARMNSIILYGVSGSAAIIVTLMLFAYFSIRRSRNEVRAANKELGETNVALEKALKAKTEFLATTSHEIRTPLNGILGMTQIMLGDRGVPGDIRERIEIVHGAGETMKALVDDLLDVAKMETGMLTLDRSEFELPRVLSEVAQLWTDNARSKGLELTLDVAECPTRIVEDERRLRQIIFNLVSNAVKFTGEGSVRIACAARHAEDGDKLVLTVTDTGIGIAPEHLEVIFHSFHQVDGGTTRQHSGTGLGLAICRDLARAMGGDVEVASEPGVGSTFTVVLPLVAVATAEPRGAAPVSTERPASLAECALLIVERNPLTQSIIEATVEDEVASVAFVDDAADAIVALRERVFHHVVVDAQALSEGQGMPELRAAAPAASITVLRTTDDAGADAALVGCGAAQLLTKPLPATDLIEALKKLHHDGSGEPVDENAGRDSLSDRMLEEEAAV